MPENARAWIISKAFLPKGAHGSSQEELVRFAMVGQWLGYEDIRRRFGGDDEPPRTLVRRSRLVMAVCLRGAVQPRIYCTPAEIWMEAGWPDDDWSAVLGLDSGAIWLFVAPGSGADFKELGLYHVLDSTNEPLALAQRMALPGVNRLSRVVFLSGPHEP